MCPSSHWTDSSDRPLDASSARRCHAAAVSCSIAPPAHAETADVAQTAPTLSLRLLLAVRCIADTPRPFAPLHHIAQPECRLTDCQDDPTWPAVRGWERVALFHLPSLGRESKTFRAHTNGNGCHSAIKRPAGVAYAPCSLPPFPQKTTAGRIPHPAPHIRHSKLNS